MNNLIFEISSLDLFYILFAHWICDFVLQTDSQAKGKSKNWKPLLDHTSIYSTCMTISLLLLFMFTDRWEVLNDYNIWIFLIITFLAHTITDYITSRVNAMYWRMEKVHNFFVSIGFDQILHYLQLYITYNILFN